MAAIILKNGGRESSTIQQARMGGLLEEERGRAKKGQRMGQRGVQRMVPGDKGGRRGWGRWARPIF